MVSDKTMNKKRLINLNYLNILEIAGEGAMELLQGQLTCDMGKVSPENPTQGAICNVKGRIISSFIAVAPNDENTNKFWLIGPELMMKKTQNVLKKYSPFYQVDISILSDKDIYGANNDALKSFFPDLNINDNQSIHHGSLVLGYLDKKIRLVITNKGDNIFKDSGEISSDLSDWHLDNFLIKDVEITEDLSEKLTPHEINYDVSERVDFEKGCYTGQEIVARMHYRAKSLPRLYLTEGSNDLAETNMSVEDSAGKRIGSVVKVLKHQKGNYALISIKADELEEGYKTSDGNTLLTINNPTI
jgi:tRNA-modifying protein YgfZ